MKLHSISDFLRTRVERGDVPSAVAGIADRDRIVYLEGFGTGRDTIFRLASMTKPITSLAAMMLVDKGRIGLDDPITKHLADYVQPLVLTASDELRPALRPIVIRDLLTNTSGHAYSFFNRTLSKMVEAGTPEAALPLVHDPGACWTYGPNTAILGRVIASVSGQTLDAFCRTRVFEPFGMPDTTYIVPAEKHHRVATQQQRDASGNFVERPNPPVIQSRGRGDDGLFSTAPDYLVFLQAFLRSDRWDAMMKNQIGDLTVQRLVAGNRSLARPFPPGAGKDKFGFGFQIETEPSEPGMRTPGSLSWLGIFNTHFWVDPKNGLAAVLLMQMLPANDEKAVDLLRGFERLGYSS